MPPPTSMCHWSSTTRLEGLRNNTLRNLRRPRALRQAAGVNPILCFISTDKAVRPTNVMGTSKRHGRAHAAGAGVRPQDRRRGFRWCGSAMYLGSSGSVVPLFRAQIKAGGPVTITHEDVTRYFMTIPEAAQLVIQAGAMATRR